MGKTHAVSGALSWALLAPLVTDSVEQRVIGLAVAGAFAYGPDLDHHGSTASRALFGPFRGKVVGVISPLLGGHRAGSHSLLSIAAVFLAVWLVAAPLWGPQLWLATACAAGWAAHILGDMLTVDGVKIFWPFSRWDVRLARLRTGGRGEKAFSLAQGCVLAYSTAVLFDFATWSDAGDAVHLLAKTVATA